MAASQQHKIDNQPLTFSWECLNKFSLTGVLPDVNKLFTANLTEEQIWLLFIISYSGHYPNSNKVDYNILLEGTRRFADGDWVNPPYAHDLPSFVFS